MPPVAPRPPASLFGSLWVITWLVVIVGAFIGTVLVFLLDPPEGASRAYMAGYAVGLLGAFLIVPFVLGAVAWHCSKPNPSQPLANFIVMGTVLVTAGGSIVTAGSEWLLSGAKVLSEGSVTKLEREVELVLTDLRAIENNGDHILSPRADRARKALTATARARAGGLKGPLRDFVDKYTALEERVLPARVAWEDAWERLQADGFWDFRDAKTKEELNERIKLVEDFLVTVERYWSELREYNSLESEVDYISDEQANTIAGNLIRPYVTHTTESEAMRSLDQQYGELTIEIIRLVQDTWGNFPELDYPGNIRFEDEAVQERMDDLRDQLGDVRWKQRDFEMRSND